MTETELRKLAEAATPGPWVTMDGVHSLWIDAPEKGQHIADVFRHIKNQPNGFPNAAFIAAANPTAVLALLDELTALRAKVKALEDALAPFAKEDEELTEQMEVTAFERLATGIQNLRNAGRAFRRAAQEAGHE